MMKPENSNLNKHTIEEPAYVNMKEEPAYINVAVDQPASVNVTEDDPEETPYAKYIRKVSGRDLKYFDESAPEYRIFGSHLHSVPGAVFVGLVGLIITIAFCIIYGLFHSRYAGLGRNEFIDTIELLDVLFAFFVGLPSHYALFYGIYYGNKRYLSPFVIFYCINFCLNILIVTITLAAFALDVQHKVIGHIRFEVSWLITQAIFICYQGLAIYVVMVVRRYLDAKEHFNSTHKNSTVPTGETNATMFPTEDTARNGSSNIKDVAV